METSADNGKNPHGYCAKQSKRIDSIEERVDGHDAAYGEILARIGEFSDIADKGYQASLASAAASANVEAALVQWRDQQRRECDLRHEPRAPLPSIDYDPDEHTLTGQEPEVAATIWKARNNESIEREAVLRAQLAAAQATLAERDRQSQRTEAKADKTWTKWQKVGGGILALIAALGGGAGLLKLFGG